MRGLICAKDANVSVAENQLCFAQARKITGQHLVYIVGSVSPLFPAMIPHQFLPVESVQLGVLVTSPHFYLLYLKHGSG